MVQKLIPKKAMGKVSILPIPTSMREEGGHYLTVRGRRGTLPTSKREEGDTT